MRSIFLAAVLLASGVWPVAASAAALGTFVSVSQPLFDFVFDDSRKLIYVKAGAGVMRYNFATNTSSGISLGTPDGGGIDISPDSSRIVVADAGAKGATKIRVHVINLDTLQDTKFETPAEYPEEGTYGVAFASNDIVYVGAVFVGSAMWTNLRTLDLRTGVWTKVGLAPFRGWFNHSPDYSEIYFSGGDADYSDSEIDRIDTATGQRRSIAVDRGLMEAYGHDSAGRFVAGGYGAFVFDADFNEIAWPGDWEPNQRPFGPGAISPVEDLLYLSTTSGPVNAYDMATGATLGSYDVGQATYYRSGRIRLSRDGSTMGVSVYRGLQVVPLYAPLTAENLTISARAGMQTMVTLPGSIGIAAPLAFSIDRPALHGKVSQSGGVAWYMPNPGFSGSDGFGYTVSLMGATAKGWVGVKVYPAGRMHISGKHTAPGTELTSPVPGNRADRHGQPLRRTKTTGVRP